MTDGEAAHRWTVHGRVQGVGFRWFVYQTARRLELGGWVRNLPDGSVEVAARGPKEAVAALEAAIEKGPPGAAVRHVEKSDMQLEMIERKSFNII